MSDIYCIASPNYRLPSEVIDKHLERVACFNPHGGKTFLSEDGRVVLHQNRIKDNSNPKDSNLKVTISANLILVMDGRIDNLDQVKKKLSFNHKIDHPSRLLLAAYRAWGEGFLEKLKGDFALILWDGANRKVIAARDCFGTLPLHYIQYPSMVVITSEIDALLEDPEFTRKPNPVLMVDFLLDNPNAMGETFFKYVFRIPPAHFLRITSAGTSVKRYWKPRPLSSARGCSDEEYLRGFRSVLSRSLEDRTAPNTEPVAFWLSGGLDSTSLICLASHLAKNKNGIVNPKAVSCIFDKLVDCDEREYIRATKKMHNFEITYVPSDQYGTFSQINLQIEPFMPCYERMQRAQIAACLRMGCRVVITGSGGDELTSGTEQLAQYYIKKRKWLQAFKEIAPLSFLKDSTFLRACIQSFLPETVVLRRSTIAIIQRMKWLRRDFLKRHASVERVVEMTHANPFQSHTQKEIYRAVTSGWVQLVHLYLYRLAKPFGIEFRNPFWDKNVVEYALSLPEELIIRRGVRKQILRRGFADIVPQEVLQRKDKTTLWALFDIGMKQQNKEYLLNLSRFERLGDMGIIDPSLAAKGYRMYLAGDHRMRVSYFWLFLFEKWLQDTFS